MGIRKKILSCILSMAIAITSVSSVYTFSAFAESDTDEIITDAPETDGTQQETNEDGSSEEDNTDDIDAFDGQDEDFSPETDANGFAIDDGVLVGYEGAGGVVTVPNTVTAIGDNAFENVSNISMLIIPGNVKSIGSAAFKNMQGMGRLIIYAGVESFAEDTFTDLPTHMGLWFVGTQEQWNQITNHGNAEIAYGEGNVFFVGTWDANPTVDGNGIIRWSNIGYTPDLTSKGFGRFALYEVIVANGNNESGTGVDSIYTVNWEDPSQPRTGVTDPSVPVNMIIAKGVLERRAWGEPGDDAVFAGTANDPATMNIFISGGSPEKWDRREKTALTVPTYVSNGFNVTENNVTVSKARISADDNGETYTYKIVTDAALDATVYILTEENGVWTFSAGDLKEGVSGLPRTNKVKIAVWNSGNTVTDWSNDISLVELKPDENGFIIDDGVLVGYKGNGGVVTVPASVTAIGDRAFESNDNISMLIIPATVKSIGAEAFLNTWSMGRLVIYAGVESFAENTFEAMPTHMGLWFIGTQEQWNQITNHDKAEAKYKYDNGDSSIHFVKGTWNANASVDNDRVLRWSNINYPVDLDSKGDGAYAVYDIVVTNGSDMTGAGVDSWYIVNHDVPSLPRTGVVEPSVPVDMIIAKGVLERKTWGQPDQVENDIRGFVGTASEPATMNIFISGGSPETDNRSEQLWLSTLTYQSNGFTITNNNVQISQAKVTGDQNGGTYKLVTNADANATVFMLINNGIFYFSARDLKNGVGGLPYSTKIKIAVWNGGNTVTDWSAEIELEEGAKPDENGFIIDKDGVLLGYVGNDPIVNIPDTVTAIADFALQGSNAAFITVPASVKTIGTGAFSDTWQCGRILYYAGGSNWSLSFAEDTFQRGHMHPGLGFWFVGTEAQWNKVGNRDSVVQAFTDEWNNTHVHIVSTWDSNVAINDGIISWDNINYPQDLTSEGGAPFASYEVVLAHGGSATGERIVTGYTLDENGNRTGVSEPSIPVDLLLAKGVLDLYTMENDNPEYDPVFDLVGSEAEPHYLSVLVSGSQGDTWDTRDKVSPTTAIYETTGFELTDNDVEVTEATVVDPHENFELIYKIVTDANDDDTVFVNMNGHIFTYRAGDLKNGVRNDQRCFDVNIAVWGGGKSVTRWSDNIHLTEVDPQLAVDPDWHAGLAIDEDGRTTWDNYNFGDPEESENWREYCWYKFFLSSSVKNGEDIWECHSDAYVSTWTGNGMINNAEFNLLIDTAKNAVLHDLKHQGTVTVRLAAFDKNPDDPTAKMHLADDVVTFTFNGGKASQTFGARKPSAIIASRHINDDGSKSDTLYIKRMTGAIGYIYLYEEDNRNSDKYTPEGWLIGNRLNEWTDAESDTNKVKLLAVDSSGNVSEWSDWIRFDTTPFKPGRITRIDPAVTFPYVETGEWYIGESYFSNYDIFMPEKTGHVEYNFDLSDVTKIVVDIEVTNKDQNRDLWNGDLSGNLYFNPACYDDAGEIGQQLHFRMENETGLTDEDDENIHATITKTGDYKYRIIGSFYDVNPLLDSDIREACNGANVGLCRDDDTLGDITVTRVELYDGTTRLVTFDANGYPDEDATFSWNANPQINNGIVTFNTLPDNKLVGINDNNTGLAAIYSIRAYNVDTGASCDYWTEQYYEKNAEEELTDVPIPVERNIILETATEDARWKYGFYDDMPPYDPNDKTGTFIVTVAGGGGDAAKNWWDDDEHTPNQMAYIGRGNATFDFRTNKTEAINEKPILQYSMLNYDEEYNNYTIFWRVAGEPSNDIIGYVALVQGGGKLDIFSAESVQDRALLWDHAKWTENNPPETITVFAVDKYGNLSAGSNATPFTELPGLSVVPESDINEFASSEKDMWLARIFINEEDFLKENGMPLDYDIDLSSLDHISVDFEVVSNKEAWDGEIGGSIVLSRSNSPDAPEDSGEGWKQNNFWGVDDEERGFEAEHNDDTCRSTFTMLSDDGFKFRYTAPITFDEFMDTGEYEPVSLDDLTLIQAAVQYWGSSPCEVRVNKVALFDEDNKVIIEFDENGNPNVKRMSIPTLTAKVTSTGEAAAQAELSWTETENAEKYILTVNGEALYTGTETSYTDEGLSFDTKYTYTVKTVMKTGTEFVSAPLTVVPTKFRGVIVRREGAQDKNCATLADAMKELTEAADYEIIVNKDIDAGNTLALKGKNTKAKITLRTIDDAKITTAATSITLSDNVVLDCDIVNSKNAPISITVPKDCTLDIRKPFKYGFGTLKGTTTSTLIIRTDITVDSIDTFKEIKQIDELDLDAAYLITVSGKLNKIDLIYGDITLGEKASVADIYIGTNAMNQSTIFSITNTDPKKFIALGIKDIDDEVVRTAIRYINKEGNTIDIPNGTIVAKNTLRNGRDFSGKIRILNTNGSGDPLTACVYGANIKAEFDGAMTLIADSENGQERFNLPTMEMMEAKTKELGENYDYTLELNCDLTLAKLSVPAKAKSFKLEGNGHTLTLTAAKAISVKYDITISDVIIDTFNTTTNKLTAWTISGSGDIIIENVDAKGLNKITGSANKIVKLFNGVKLNEKLQLGGKATAKLYIFNNITLDSIATFGVLNCAADDAIDDSADAVVTVTGKVNGLEQLNGTLKLTDPKGTAAIKTVGNASLIITQSSDKKNVTKVTVTAIADGGSLSITVVDDKDNIVKLANDTLVLTAGKANTAAADIMSRNITIVNTSTDDKRLGLFLNKAAITAQTADAVIVKSAGTEKAYPSLAAAFNEMTAGGDYEVILQKDITVTAKMPLPSAALSSLRINGDGHKLVLEAETAIAPKYDLAFVDIQLETKAGKLFTVTSAKGVAQSAKTNRELRTLEFRKFTSDTLKEIKANPDSKIIIGGNCSFTFDKFAISGNKTAELFIDRDITLETLKSFYLVETSSKITVRDAVSGINKLTGMIELANSNVKQQQKADITELSEASVILRENPENKKGTLASLTIAKIGKESSIRIDDKNGQPKKIASGTEILLLKTAGCISEADLQAKLAVINEDSIVLPYAYGKSVLAEDPTALTMTIGDKTKDYPNIDKAFADITSADECVIKLNTSITITKMPSLPRNVKIKKLKIWSSNNSGIILKAANLSGLPYSLELDGISIDYQSGKSKDLVIGVSKDCDLIINNIHLVSADTVLTFKTGKDLKVSGNYNVKEISGFTGTVELSGDFSISAKLEAVNLTLKNANITPEITSKGAATIKVTGKLSGTNSSIRVDRKSFVANGRTSFKEFAGIDLSGKGTLAENGSITIKSVAEANPNTPITFLKGFKKGVITIDKINALFSSTDGNFSIPAAGTTAVITVNNS